jgi:hypothetical protein
VHRQLTAAPNLAALAPLQHIPVDPVGRRDVPVSDLIRDVLMVGNGRKQRRDAGFDRGGS